MNESVTSSANQRDRSIWIESHASWRGWIEKTPGIEAAKALRISDEWRHDIRRRDANALLQRRTEIA